MPTVVPGAEHWLGPRPCSKRCSCTHSSARHDPWGGRTCATLQVPPIPAKGGSPTFGPSHATLPIPVCPRRGESHSPLLGVCLCFVVAVFGTGWDVGPRAAVFAPGQTSPPVTDTEKLKGTGADSGQETQRSKSPTAPSEEQGAKAGAMRDLCTRHRRGGGQTTSVTPLAQATDPPLPSPHLRNQLAPLEHSKGASFPFSAPRGAA